MGPREPIHHTSEGWVSDVFSVESVGSQPTTVPLNATVLPSTPSDSWFGSGLWSAVRIAVCKVTRKSDQTVARPMRKIEQRKSGALWRDIESLACLKGGDEHEGQNVGDGCSWLNWEHTCEEGLRPKGRRPTGLYS